MNVEDSFESLAHSPAGLRRRNKTYQAAKCSTAFVQALDRVQVLGSGEESDHYQWVFRDKKRMLRKGSQGPSRGHLGCINALAWNEDGSLLASGSDDFRLCLWKVGQDIEASDPTNDVATSSSRLGYGLQTIIHTAHTRNIFSVKFLPHTNSNRIVSCAGDAKVKIFDIGRASHSQISHKGKEWSEITAQTGLLREYRCHTDRAKRISVEESPDVFMTCSEDGTVRQFDLREPHTCNIPGRTTCGPPLADYSSFGISLYTLSLSKLRPELFVCGGTSAFAFLHDRRMHQRRFQSEWKVDARDDLLSQCVRRFSILDEDGGIGFSEKHITACKLSERNGRELLLSYSDGPVALFDIFGETTAPATQTKRKRTLSNPDSATPTRRKTKKGSDPVGDASVVRRRIIRLLCLDGQNIDSVDSAAALEAIDTLQAITAAESDQPTLCLVRSCAQLHHAGRSEALQELQRANHPDFKTLQDQLESDAPLSDLHKRFADRLRTDWPDAFLQWQVSSQETTSQPDKTLSNEPADPSTRDEETSPVIDETNEALLQEMLADEGSASDEELEDTSESEDSEIDAPPPMLDRRRRRQTAHAEVPAVLPIRTYSGHVNRDTVKDVNFAFQDEHVMSGSDDGRLYIWNTASGQLENILEGDASVVNVMQPHPLLPVLAVSGIDSTVKLFAPTSSSPKRFSALADAERIVQNNQRARTRSHSAFSGSTSSTIMAVLASRIMARREAEAIANGQVENQEHPRNIRLTRAEIEEIIQEEDRENCVIV